MTFYNEMSHMSTKNELVTSLEIKDLSHTQPKLLDAEHAWSRKFQTEKSTLEVCRHVSTRSSTSSFQNQAGLLLLLHLMLSK